MASVSLSEALTAFGRPATEIPRHPVFHGPAGALVTFGVLSGTGPIRYSGVWIGPKEIRFLEHEPKETGAAGAHQLRGNSALLFELYLAAARAYLERVEEIDERLAEAQQRGRSIPLSEVWTLQRHVAAVRAQIGRALVGFAECTTRFSDRFPAIEPAAPTVTGELVRVRELAMSVQQGLSDLILLRNAEESNRIAEAANALTRTSNRIAALANTSNIRMLGLTYIALVLGLVSAAALIPNTGATILGMPSASWVPGIWVDLILIVLIVIPAWLIFSRRWVRKILVDLEGAETRAEEGIDDLPEVSAADATHASARSREPSPGKPL
ncbi:MAG: hypothetical protein L3K06_02875 [Thermoplasmata archaeon]|nr:hypothetical protein [Thermoplasmata archaeon]